MMRRRLALLVFVATALVTTAAPSGAIAAGELDTSFGSGGVTQLGAGSELNGIAALSDGSSIAVGRGAGNMIAVELTPAGQLLGGFGSGGIATAVQGGVAHGVAIQPDGKIVVAGDNCSGFGSGCSSGGLLVARLNANGSLDSSFGNGGAESIVDLPSTFGVHGQSVAIAPGGKIVVGGDQPQGGFAHMVVIRLNTDGSLDTSFGSGGIAHADLGEDSSARGIEVQPNGKIVVAGPSGPGAHQVVNGFVARLNTNGAFDSSFGGVGTPAGGCINQPGVYWYCHPVSGANSTLNDAVLDPAGGIAAAGWDTQDLQRQALFVRLSCAGQPQAGFGSGGVATIPSATAGTGQPAGANAVGVSGGDRVIGAGRYQDSGQAEVGVWGLQTTGAAAFTTTQLSQAEGRGMAIDSSGRALVAGAILDLNGAAKNGLVARYVGFGAPPSATGVCGSGPIPQPPAVTTGDASDVTKSGAAVSGTVNPNGQNTTYHFEYGTTTEYGQSTGSSDAGSGSAAVPVTVSLTGLDPGTTYHYRLVAANASGATPGGDRTFTTNGSPAEKSKARVLASDVFLNGSGSAAKVYVGCLGGSGCSGSLVIRARRDDTLLAKKGSYKLRRNRGTLIGAPLTDDGARRLRRSRSGALGVTVAVKNDSGQGKTVKGRLIGPDARLGKPHASLDAPRAFATPAGKARVWLGCLGAHRCEGKLRLLEDDARVARAAYSAEADSAKLVGLNLDSQATSDLNRDGRLKVQAAASNDHGAAASRKLVLLESG